MVGYVIPPRCIHTAPLLTPRSVRTAYTKKGTSFVGQYTFILLPLCFHCASVMQIMSGGKEILSLLFAAPLAGSHADLAGEDTSEDGRRGESALLTDILHLHRRIG